MKYDLNYMFTHDIDWFCIVNGSYVHVASAGGLLPEEMRDRDTLRELQYQVSVAPDLFSDNEIEYNEKFLNNRFENGKGREDYVRSFRDMAKKGFTSMDRTNVSDPESNTYHVVCCPNSNLTPLCEDGKALMIPYSIDLDNPITVESEGVNLLKVKG